MKIALCDDEKKYLDEIEVEVDSNANYVLNNVNCYLCDDDGNIERTVGYDHQFLKDRICRKENHSQKDNQQGDPKNKCQLFLCKISFLYCFE